MSKKENAGTRKCENAEEIILYFSLQHPGLEDVVPRLRNSELTLWRSGLPVIWPSGFLLNTVHCSLFILPRLLWLQELLHHQL